MKRKEGSQLPDRSSSKKVKKEENDEKIKLEGGVQGIKLETIDARHQPRDRSKIAETFTDSDPLVESDTTSESGADDGVSWPSDEEPEEEEEAAEDGNEDEREDGDGGVRITSNSTTHATPVVKAKPADGGTNSREAHAKQKAAAVERKAAKPNADLIARSKKLWERLRRKSHVPLEERKKLVAELFEIITGRVKDFVFKHDSVRVIQTALKYANLQQRKMIAKELKGEYKALSESKYAKFLVGKILVHGDDEIRDLVVPEFYGGVRRMMKHPEASWILDDVYRGAATRAQKTALLREWYGAEFALFKTSGTKTTAELDQLLEESPEKKKPIMRALHDLINLLVQKKTTGFTMLHDAMLQYYRNVQPTSEEANEFIEMLKGDEEGDLLKNLAFTPSGALVVCYALANATAKDRKLILRAFKGTISMMAWDPHAHKVILTAFDVIDDTVLTSKQVIPELLGKEPESETQQQELIRMANGMTARAALLYPFCGKSKAIIPVNDLELIQEIHRIRQTTSKKDAEVRRKELVANMSSPMLNLIKDRTVDLLATSFGCQFISEILLSAAGDRAPAMEAILRLLDTEKDKFKSAAAARMLKTLVGGGHYNHQLKQVEITDASMTFRDLLYEKIKPEILQWALGDDSFIIVGMLETPNFAAAGELKSVLRKQRSKLVELSEGVAAEAGMEKDGSRQKFKKKRNGNPGAKILLKKLDE